MKTDDRHKINNKDFDKTVEYLKSQDLTIIEKVETILSLKDEELIVECLVNPDIGLGSDMKTPIIMGLKNKKLILRCLERRYCLNPSDRARIVCSIDDDEFKLECLLDSRINFGFCKFDDETTLDEIVNSFKNEEYKKCALEEFSLPWDNFSASSVIIHFEKDEDKWWYLNNQNRFRFGLLPQDKAIIICSLKSREDKIRCIEDKNSDLSEEDKLLIVCSIYDEEGIRKFLGINHLKEFQTGILPDNLTFGVELECEGEYAKYVKGMNNFLEGWNIKGDFSLKEGVELSSPIFHWKKENIHSLEIVCDILKKLGLQTSLRCGGHIHFWADFLGKDYKAWQNFFTIYYECEELFYKLSCKEGETLRFAVTQYATKANHDLSRIFSDGNIVIESEKDLQKILRSLQRNRVSAVSFFHIGHNNINTIEVRMPNGTLDIDTLKENIRLFGQLLNVSKQLSNNPNLKKEELELLKRHDLTEREKLEVLLNILFFDENEKDIYRRRWNSIKDENIYNEVQAETPTFKRGNYSMREQIRPIYHETKLEDRMKFVKFLKEFFRVNANSEKQDLDR